MKTISEYLSGYPKHHKLRTALYVAVMSLLILSFLFWEDVDEYVLQKAPEKLPGLIIIILIGVIAVLYSYIRYEHEEILINDQANPPQNFQYSFKEQSVAKAESPESLNSLFSDIKDAQLNLMKELLTFNGIIASIFLSLIIIELRDKVLAIIGFGVFLAVIVTILRNIFVSMRVFSAMLFAINLSEEQRRQDKFQEGVTRLGIRHRQNIHLAIFFTGLQLLFIFYLLMFEFSFGVMK
jgi:hypothetical protein